MDPKNTKAYYNMGVAFENKNNLEKANVFYGKAISIDSRDYASYYNRANNYFHLGMYREALNDYNGLYREQIQYAVLLHQ